MPSPSSWYRSPRFWLDLFVLANLGCLAPDIYLAHSTNGFRHAAEWIPLAFSLAAPLVLLAGLGISRGRATSLAWRLSGLLVGWTALAVGVMGLLLHLESQFFRERTLDSLVYTAPFAAPLAYSGIGLLAIMNRMVGDDTPEWPRWVTLLALGAGPVISSSASPTMRRMASFTLRNGSPSPPAPRPSASSWSPS